MASRTLYPVTVDSYMPAFKAEKGENGYCRIYYSLSKFNSSSDFKSVHISVVKQNTGMNVIKLVDSPSIGRYRSTGIIINAPKAAVEGEENLYYVDIYNNDLSSVDGSYSGWIPGWIYKVQLRLCSADSYNSSSGIGQSVWLKNHSGEFSEWSTICIVKATGKIDYKIPLLDIDTRNENININVESRVLEVTTLDLSGRFFREIDPSEIIHYYEFTLYDNNDNILEETGQLFSNQYQDNDNFNYVMKTQLQNEEIYKLAFKFTTLNGYVGGFYGWDEDSDNRYIFTCSDVMLDRPPCRLITVENDINKFFIENKITSLVEEEDEGRIALKFYDPDDNPYSGNLCIRRSDSRTNFTVWEDIYRYVAKNIQINSIPIFYDYTIESGIWYQYGVQIVEEDIGKGIHRGILQTLSNPVMRNFNYSFLLGKNNQQLKLMFDNNMNSFKYQVYDSKNDPIGSQFTNIARNAATYYRTFPINGLISFWMDENSLFCDKKVIYNYEDIIELYNQYNSKNSIVQYDYIYERDFRDKVLEFLQDGDYKLFKSPTEGNIIVRLTDVNCVPNQSLDRMLYSFTSNAYEMDKCTMENYFKYGFYNLVPIENDFSTYEIKLGQIQMDFPIGTNVFQEIYKKYDSGNRNIGGYSQRVGNIHHIKITFDDKPLRVKNSAGELVMGNNFILNGTLFTVYNPVRIYEFDNRLIYTTRDTLTIQGNEHEDIGQNVSTVHATIDFLYEVKYEPYKEKTILTRHIRRGVGQIFLTCTPNQERTLYDLIFYKYYTEWKTDFVRLNALEGIEIEANPGAVFAIKDINEIEPEEHMIGDTGQLRLENIENIIYIDYIGMKNVSGGLDKVNCDVLINYQYVLLEGTYKEET